MASWEGRRCSKEHQNLVLSSFLVVTVVTDVAGLWWAGSALYGVMVSWLYALYSFDYRWGLSNKRLPERIAFFQQHWAFFLGVLWRLAP